MGDHTAESLRAEVESWLWNDPIGRQVAENAIDAMEVAERERDEARAVAKEVEAEAFYWKDEAAEAVERNAVISEERNDARAEVERLRRALGDG